MKRILTSFALVAASVAFSQVSISGETNDVPQATLDVKAITGKANGVLVPRVTRAEAAVMAKPTNESGAEVDIVESTLIYVNVINGTASGYATEVNDKGFYYFKDGKWVKLGGGVAAETPFPAATRRVIEAPSNDVQAAFQKEIDEGRDPKEIFIVKLTGGRGDDIVLPDASLYPGQVISLNNFVPGNVNYASGILASLTTTMRVASSHLLWSDGTGWWCLSSRNG